MFQWPKGSFSFQKMFNQSKEAFQKAFVVKQKFLVSKKYFAGH